MSDQRSSQSTTKGSGAPTGLPQFSPQTMALLQASLPSVYGGPIGIIPVNSGTTGPAWPIASANLQTPNPLLSQLAQQLATRGAGLPYVPSPNAYSNVFGGGGARLPLNIAPRYTGG